MTGTAGAGPPGSDHPSRAVDAPNPLPRIYALVMVFDLGEAALRFLVPVFLVSRGYGMGAVGLTVSAFAVATLCSRVPAGMTYRPERARMLILGAGAASTVAFVAAPFAPNLPTFVACMVLDGFGWGVGTTALLSLMMTSRPTSVPARSAMGWYVGFTGLGHALAGVVGGFTGDLVGVRDAMLMLAALPLLASLALCWRVPPPARPEATLPGGAPSRPSLRHRTWGRLSALPAAVWLTCLVAVYLNVMNATINTFFPVLGLSMGFTLSQIGSLAGLKSGVSAVTRFLAVPVLKHVSPGAMYLPMLVLNAVSTIGLPLPTVYLTQALLWMTHGASRGLLRVSTGTQALESVDAGQEGMAAAVMSAGLDVGKVIGPLLGGLVADATTLAVMFHVLPLPFMVASLAVLALVRRRGRQLAVE